MKPIRTGAFLAVAALAIGGTALAQPENSGRKVSTVLTGAAERPGPGDPDGSGSFHARINSGQEQICYELKVGKIAAATAAHIHKAPPTSAGPVVVPLAPPTFGESAECKAISRELAMAIIQNPQDYYVNVHNSDFPPGAVRGQLRKGD